MLSVAKMLAIICTNLVLALGREIVIHLLEVNLGRP